MNATSEPDPSERALARDGDLPALRAALGAVAAAGLCLGVALALAAILGAQLGETAAKVAASGVICGLLGLFALSASTLHQRSFAWQLLGLIGVVTSTLVAAELVILIWSGAHLGETATRASGVAGLAALTVGFVAFLLTQQRAEDSAGVRALMFATLALGSVLGIAAALSIIFNFDSSSTLASSPAGDVQLVSGGLGFTRFLSVVGLLTLLGSLLLPIVRRANPGFRALAGSVRELASHLPPEP